VLAPKDERWRGERAEAAVEREAKPEAPEGREERREEEKGRAEKSEEPAGIKERESCSWADAARRRSVVSWLSSSVSVVPRVRVASSSTSE